MNVRADQFIVFFRRDLNFTDCKMYCIEYTWFQIIWPNFWKWSECFFSKALPCKYISYSFEWAYPLEVKMVGQLKGRSGLYYLESHCLKRHSGHDFAKVKQCHAIVQVKYCNSCLGSVKAGLQIDIAGIMGVTQGAISKILKQVQQTRSPNQRPLGHRQKISAPREDRYLLRMRRAKSVFLQSQF